MTKTKRLKTLFRNPFVIFGLIVLAMGLIALAFTLLTRNTSLFVGDKPAITDSLASKYATINLPGEQIQSDFVDRGCTKAEGMLFTADYDCTLEARKLYRNNQGANADIKKTDEVLRALGFTPRDGSFAPSDITGQTNAVAYTSSSNARMTAFLYYFKIDGRHLDPSDYLRLDNKISLTPDQYIYGVRFYASYWSCEDESWLQRACPATPTPVLSDSSK